MFRESLSGSEAEGEDARQYRWGLRIGKHKLKFMQRRAESILSELSEDRYSNVYPAINFIR
jgi:hypothetical protein